MCVLITFSRSSLSLLREMCCPWCPFEEQSVGPFFVVVFMVQNSWWKPFPCFVPGSWLLQGHGGRDEAFEIS